MNAVRRAVTIPVVGAGTATYHAAAQLAERIAVISVNEHMNPVFLRPVRNAGCYDRMISMQAIRKPLTLPIGDFYTPEELEEEIIRIGRKQREEGAQVLVIACTLISLLLPPGGVNRLREKLGLWVVDPQPVAIKTAEILAGLRSSHDTASV